MDLERMRVIYNCFIAGGFVVPVLDVLVGAIGGALDLGADADVGDDFVGTIRVHSASGSLVCYVARPAEGIARIPVGQAVTVVEVDPERMVCIAAPLEDKQES